MASNYAGNRAALAYWGTIQAAAAARLTTAQVWQALQDAAFARAEWLEGLPPGGGVGNTNVAARAAQALKGVTIQDVNALRGIAGQCLRAKTLLNRARPEEAVTFDMIGIPPNSVTPGSR